MNQERLQHLDQPTRAALDELRELIQQRFPAANFSVAHGDDPEGVYLRATVDVEDVDEVVDQKLLDRLYEIQVEQGLAVYVIPLQSLDRVLATIHEPSLGKQSRFGMPIPGA